MAARAGTGNDRDKEGRVVSRRRAVVAILLALTFVLTTSTGEARDRTETCSSYTTMGGTTHETCRSPGQRERT